MKAVRRLLWAALLLVAVQYAAGAALFLAYPDTRLDGRSDAVVVLAGSVHRLPVARTLMEQRVAPVLLVSSEDGSDDVARARFCAAESHPYPVICRRAVPFSTRGESRLAAAVARERGWTSVVVVTSRFHLFRARMLMRRCTDAALAMRGVSEPWYSPVKAIPSEWIKLALAVTTRRGC